MPTAENAGPSAVVDAAAGTPMLVNAPVIGWSIAPRWTAITSLALFCSERSCLIWATVVHPLSSTLARVLRSSTSTWVPPRFSGV